MSSFDDEFGLFGDEVPAEEEERKPTLGARKIATRETVIDEIEPEDEPSGRRRGFRGSPEGERRPPGSGPPRRRRDSAPRAPLAPEIAHARAVGLLEFLAKKLVSKPDAVAVELHPDDRGAVLELEVDPEDLGKVIGRGGRVAQALRTIVRAGAEGRVTIDIIDVDEEYEDDDEPESPEAAKEGSPD